MSNPPNTLVVYKGRTNVITVSLGYDVSADTITSEIRTAGGTLIVAWTVAFVSDGVDGELKLTLDNSVVSTVEHTTGLMDLKRVSGGEPLPVFEQPLEVEFRETVTV